MTANTPPPDYPTSKEDDKNHDDINKLYVKLPKADYPTSEEEEEEEEHCVDIYNGDTSTLAHSTSFVSFQSSGNITVGGTHIENLQNQTEILTASTKFVLNRERRKPYAKTKKFTSALRYLRGSKKLIILSNLGDGRTSLGLQLLIELNDVESEEHPLKEPLILRRASEWRFAVNPLEDTVVFLDDIFGRMVLNEKHYKEWETVLPDVQAAIDDVDSCLFLIIAMNKYIFKQVKHRLQRYELFSEMDRYTVDLTSYDSKDKKLILTKVVRNVEQSDITEILDIQKPVAFPLCCSSFARNPVYSKQGGEFFKNPTEILYVDLMTLCESDKSAFILLLVILFSEADVYLKDIFCNDTMSSLMRQLTNLCYVEYVDYTSLLGRLEIKVKHLSNVFIDDTGGKLSFMSSAIESSMIKAFGNMHKGYLIECLRFKLLAQNITLDDNNEKKVFINEYYYANVSKRFIKELERVASVPKIKEYITSIAHSEITGSDMFRRIFVGEFVRMRNFKEIIQCKEDKNTINIISTLLQDDHENSHMLAEEILIKRTNINNRGCCGLSDWFTREFQRSVRLAIKNKDVKACKTFAQFNDLPISLYYGIREIIQNNRSTLYSMNIRSIDTAL